MSKSLYIASGVALFAVLYVVQWNVYRPRIERDLTRRTLAALENQPFRVTSAQFSGRDGSIQIEAGENPQHALQAQRLAAQVFGVRVAQVTAAASQKDAPTLRIERTGERISLRGSVPHASVAALFEDAAQAAFDGMTIKNELRVEATTHDAPYLRGMRLMIGLLAQTAPEGTLELSETTVRLSGDVPNSAAAVALQAKAQERLPRGLELIVELTPAVTEPERVVAKAPLSTLPILHFGFDSVALTSESTSAFEPLLSLLKSASTENLRITGHADSKGSDAYNQKLSLRRAQHVAHLLKKQGVRARLQIEGRGETQPAADNGTDEGRAQNRRVELKVLGGG